jgi:hypothetical protein
MQTSHTPQRRANEDHVTIVVLANKRLGAVKRLLGSLRNADYGLDNDITLHIRLEARQPPDLVDFVVKYHWPHGEKVVHSRIVQGGLIAAVVESWFPTNDHEFGLILEDDLEVSPVRLRLLFTQPLKLTYPNSAPAALVQQLYYLWLKASIRWYRESGSPERVVGVSLYTPRTTETGTLCPPLDRECRRFDAQDLISRLTARPNSPYLQQLPCSWGAVYFPRAWREFARYMQFRVNQNNTTPLLIPGSRTTGWGKSWKKYFVEYMYINGYFLLYPNFPNQASLSTNHLEEGEHIMRNVTSHSHLNEDFTVPLLRNRSLMEILTNLPGPSQITPPAERRGHHHHYHHHAPFICGGLKDGDPSALYGGWCEGGVVDLNKLPALDLFATPYDSTFDANDPNAKLRRAWMPAGEELVLAPPPRSSAPSSSTPAMLQSDAVPCTHGSPFCRAQFLIQEDGNMVVNVADFGAVHGKNLWMSKSGKKKRIGRSMVVQLESDGNLVLAADDKQNSKKKLWQSGYRDVLATTPAASGYYLHISPEALLAVYRGSHPCEKCDRAGHFPCNHLSMGVCTLDNGTDIDFRIESASWPVWRKGNPKPVQRREGYDMCPPWRRRVPRNHESEYCDVYHEPVANYLRRGEEEEGGHFTVMISYLGRSSAIFATIRHYASMKRTDKIVVVWRDASTFPPQDMKIGNVLVHFLVGNQPYQSACRPGSESSNPNSFVDDVVSFESRFIRPPSMLIRTRAVLAVDDDVLVHEDDCGHLLEAWRRRDGDGIGGGGGNGNGNGKDNGNDNGNAMAGLFPVAVEADGTMRPPTIDSGFNMLLTSAVMVSIELLHSLRCGAGKASHGVIDDIGGGEGVALNLLARRTFTRLLHVSPTHEVCKIVHRRPPPSGKTEEDSPSAAEQDFFLPNQNYVGRSSAPADGLARLLKQFRMTRESDLTFERKIMTRGHRAATHFSSGAVLLSGVGASLGLAPYTIAFNLPVLRLITVTEASTAFL